MVIMEPVGEGHDGVEPMVSQPNMALTITFFISFVLGDPKKIRKRSNSFNFTVNDVTHPYHFSNKKMALLLVHRWLGCIVGTWHGE